MENGSEYFAAVLSRRGKTKIIFIVRSLPENRPKEGRGRKKASRHMLSWLRDFL